MISDIPNDYKEENVMKTIFSVQLSSATTELVVG